ncbi:TetR/AcrR family transcriptional regulator [Ramlibacter sp. MAHUQ-53]|uniref:TetR/AcrR family transcriptional regulator n=1 Tax=unclassified Ramlibacter TaxID=2617605 RepID=UPI00362DE455
MDTPADDGHVKRERRKQARPGELLGAALELFVEKGYAATRVEEVAARAGVSKGTLFIYYPSKVDLFKAVVSETIAGRMAEWDAEFATYTGPTADMVRHCLRSWWERIGATRACGITKLMLSEARNFPELAEFYQREVVRPGQDLVRRVLQRGIDRGEFRPVDLDHAIHVVIGPMVYLMLSRHSTSVCVPDDRPMDPERFIDMLADILILGLSLPAKESP